MLRPCRRLPCLFVILLTGGAVLALLLVFKQGEMQVKPVIVLRDTYDVEVDDWRDDTQTRRVTYMTSQRGQRPADTFSSPIRFDPFVYNPEVEDPYFDPAVKFPCSLPSGIAGPDGIEDLMCIPRPDYLPNYKNPCYRSPEGQLKCMPYYQLLGFDKCGTTDLMSRLVQHPDIAKCDAHLGKEIYYWAWRRYGVWLKNSSISVMQFSGYIHAFRSAAEQIEAYDGRSCQPIVGDGGPLDAWEFRGWPRDPQNRGLAEPRVLSPHHLRHLSRDPKFILMVRDPVERMFSDYLFVGDGYSAADFDRDVPVAIQMMEDCLKVNSLRQCFFSDEMYKKLPMRLHISCYAVFIREWLSVFHKKHFFVLRTEDYKKDGRGSLRKAFTFLGVDTLADYAIDEILSDEKKQNENTRKKNVGTMSDKTRKMLEDFYAPCNQELRDLFDDDRFLWQDY